VRLLPFPRLWVVVFATWLVLNASVAPGHLLLGALVATFAGLSVAALDLPGSRPKRIGTILSLAWVVLSDIVRSNIAVMKLLLSGRPPRSAFVSVPLELKDGNGLAVLACIVTATPGSAWIHYDSVRSRVVIHVLDTEDEAAWAATLKHIYERRLQEIFE
jgi:multicomponent K+:H+ antiporter subunit E